MDPLELIFVPLIIFVGGVLPIWIIVHYVTIWKRENRDRKKITGTQTELESMAERMERRIDVIEQLLDAEDDEWRKHT